MGNKKLIVVVGATAVGKTSYCIDLAKKLQTVIVSADSRQFYRQMNIGTAKPNAEELVAVQHFFINSQDITDNYNVGQYEKDALLLLDRLFEQHDTVILTGGSGLYVKAVCEGIDEMPAIPNSLRQQLNERYLTDGLPILLAELARLDANYYAQVDKNNPQRILRGLEVCLASGKPYSWFRKKQATKRPFEIQKIGLHREREVLYRRIDQRVDDMLAQGLLQEVESLLPYRACNALQTVGYTEVFDYLDGKYDWQTCIDLLKQHTRNYAKRQLTWFRRDEQIQWVEL
jgi:tRNA dimethylallyltransferase